MLKKLTFLKLCDTKTFETIAIYEEMEKKIFNCGLSERISERF